MTEIDGRLCEALTDRYAIQSRLGEGGMATVYLADDIKHERRVALKVLKPELAAVIGGDRFVTEIKTTAGLQHPHILPLFDSGEADGFLYYVMPYVDGESLRDRLDHERQLDVDEAVVIAEKVASALQYAHEHDVIHRDIKPENILMHAGEPVVADFGIALAISAAGGGRLTETGLSLGTPHYMSPEQATADRDLTARSDVYALGCVLYEMLTGAPPHTGPTAQSILMRILTEDARPVIELRRSVPPHVSSTLAKALEKLPADRFKSAEEFKRALGATSFAYVPKTGETTAVHAASGGSSRAAVAWGADGRTKLLVGANVLLLVVAGWALTQSGASSSSLESAPVHRFVVDDSLRTNVNFDVSVNGDLVYDGVGDGETHLRIRRAADTVFAEIPGTTGGFQGSFSPNGEWIVFATQGEGLKKVQVGTGTVVSLVRADEVPNLAMPHWGADGTIVFSSGNNARIHRVPAVGGDTEQISGAIGLTPRLLPDGRTLVYTALSGQDFSDTRIVMYDLETADTTTIIEQGGSPRWSATGHILHGHTSGTVFAVPFDLDARKVTGPSVPVREGVFSLGMLSFFDVSESGAFAYVTGVSTEIDVSQVSFAWVDMAGEVTPINLQPTDHGDVRLSPDGRRIAYTRSGEIYIFDLDLGSNQPFTFEGGNHHDPVWSPDGTRVAFSSVRAEGRGSGDVYVKDVDGRSPARWVAGGESEDYASDWLDDGTLIYRTRENGGAPYDIFTAPDDASGEPTALLQADWNETFPAVSPDGRWIAYVSDENGGANHLFVRQFPSLTGRWQVSQDPVAVAWPLWAPDGSALFFRDPEANSILRASLETSPTFRVVSVSTINAEPMQGTPVDIHPDGGRILIVRPTGVEAFENAEPRLVVAANWFTELRERLGDGG